MGFEILGPSLKARVFFLWPFVLYREVSIPEGNCLNSFLEPTNHSGGSTTQIESFLISVFRHDILMSPETRCISLINIVNPV